MSKNNGCKKLIKTWLKMKKAEDIAEREYCANLVQKAVEVGQRIRDWMHEYIRFNEGRLDAIAGSGQAEVLKREGDKMLRRFNRRVRALERVREIQARAFKKAYGTDPPTIEGIG